MRTTGKAVTQLSYLVITVFCSITVAYAQEIPIPLLRTLNTGHDGVSSIAFSPDGNNLASVGYGPSITLWHVQTGRILKTIRSHYEYTGFTSLAFHPNGRMITTGGCDGLIALWDFETGRIIKPIKEQVSSCTYPFLFVSVAFSPDGKILATGVNDNTTILWDVETGKSLKNLRWQSEYTREVNTVAFSPDGKILASGGSYETIKIWDIRTGQELKTFDWYSKYPCEVKSVAFSPDGRILAGGYEQEQTIKLWSIQTGRELRAFTWQAERRGTVHADVYSVAFSPDGNTLAAASDDGGAIKLFDVQTFRVIKTIIGHSKTVISVAFSPDGKILASAGEDDKTIKLWDVSLLDPGLAKVYFANEREKETELHTIAQLLKPKNEFETEAEYKARIAKGNEEKKIIEEKYAQKYPLLKQEYETAKQTRMEAQARDIEARIKASIMEVTLRVSGVGLYNADNETLPITIEGVTKIVRIPRAEAKSFKDKWQSAVVKGSRRLQKDLSTFEYIGLVIIHPETGSNYRFGEP